MQFNSPVLYENIKNIDYDIFYPDEFKIKIVNLIYDIAGTIIKSKRDFKNQTKNLENLLKVLDKEETFDNKRILFLKYLDDLGEKNQNSNIGQTEKIVEDISDYIINNVNNVWIDLKYDRKS